MWNKKRNTTIKVVGRVRRFRSVKILYAEPYSVGRQGGLVSEAGFYQKKSRSSKK